MVAKEGGEDLHQVATGGSKVIDGRDGWGAARAEVVQRGVVGATVVEAEEGAAEGALVREERLVDVGEVVDGRLEGTRDGHEVGPPIRVGEVGRKIVKGGENTFYLVGLGQRGGLRVRDLRRDTGEVGQEVLLVDLVRGRDGGHVALECLLGGQVRGGERGRDRCHDLPDEAGDSGVQSR